MFLKILFFGNLAHIKCKILFFGGKFSFRWSMYLFWLWFSYHFPMFLTVLILMILTHTSRLHFNIVLKDLVCLICKKKQLTTTMFIYKYLRLLLEWASYLQLWRIQYTYIMNMSKKMIYLIINLLVK